MRRCLYVAFCFFSLASVWGLRAQHSEVALTALGTFSPQSTRFDVAAEPEGRWCIGIPFLSRIGVNVTSRISAQEYIGDKNPARYARNHNLLGSELLSEGLLVGYKDKKKRYYSFSMTHVVQASATYPKNLLETIWVGNSFLVDNPQTYFRTRGSALAYREWSIGLSLPVSKYWRVGGRLKYLQGLAAVSVPYGGEFSARVGDNPLDIFLLPESTSAQTAGIGALPNDRDSLIGYYIGNSNQGVAIDLGFTYAVNLLWNVRMSVRDIGFISWSEATETYVVNGEDDIVLTGTDITDADIDDVGDQFYDQITRRGQESFSTFLNTSVTASSDYLFARDQYFIVAVEAQRFASPRGWGRFAYTAALSYLYTGLFPLRVGGSLIRHPQDKFRLGVAASYYLGAFQVYASLGNVIGLVDVEALEVADITFGMNIVWGYPKPRVPATLCP